MTNPCAKVEEIALYLGKPWKFSRLGDVSNWRFDIIDGCGRGLYFRLDGDKFKIGGVFPRHKSSPWRDNYKDIGVSINRPAKDIATDIMRRLMPHYLKSYEAALLRYEQEQEQENHLALIAQSIVKVTGGRISDHSRARKTVYFENGEAEIWSSGDMTLNLNRLSVEQAIQIVSILQEDEP